ncbi:hypothetical protein SK224_16695, partial [Microbacterium sp. BG28]|uniref:hypothetical protein n=1 Tax=Microbacterium sp. BG28 TaxID=3097356 RepID=UPI002A5AE6F1
AIGGKIADDVPPLITEQAAPLVDAAITAADIPGQASDAVEADIAGRDLVQRTDPGISRVKTFENDEYARAWGGGPGLGRVFGGWTRFGWFKMPRGFDFGNRRARMATSDQFLRASVIGTRVAEDALDLQGNVPLSILKRWGQRLANAGTAALAFWPFQPKPTTIIRTVRPAGGGDFTTIAAAIAACSDGSPAKRYVIDVGDGVFNEVKLLRDSSYITLRGRHKSTTRINGYLDPSSTDTQVADASTIDLRGTECYIEHLTVTIQNGRYAVHPELNGLNLDSVYGWDSCDFEHLGNDEVVAWRAANPSQTGAGFDRVATGGFNGGRCAIGEGTASGAQIIGKNSVIKGASTYFLHDNSAFTKPSFHRFERCSFVGTSILILNPIGAGLDSLLEFVESRFDAERIVFQDSGWLSTSTDQPASHY